MILGSWLNKDNVSMRNKEALSLEDSAIPIEELTQIYKREWNVLISERKVRCTRVQIVMTFIKEIYKNTFQSLISFIFG